MDENPYQPPKSPLETAEPSAKPPNLSFQNVWDALPGWVRLTILLVLVDLVGMWVSASRTGVVIFLSVTGILAMSVFAWLVWRKPKV